MEPDAPTTPHPDAHPLRGVVVSHTHWDRAWYLPFERFRLRLVRLVDRVLDLLDGDPAFRAFTLDGQTILLDDYFAVRPEAEPRVAALVRAGRLVVGPFHVLPDLFLASGESLIRNVQTGFAWRRRLGSPDAPVGYVPDPFGQPEAVPTLLAGFGITTFVLSRGVSAAHKTDAGALFRWRGPDGAEVTALYARDGYFNAAALGHREDFGRLDGAAPDLATALAQLDQTQKNLAPLQPPGTPLLLLNGFDHMPEQPGLPALLDAVRAARPDADLRHGTLAEFFEAVDADDLPAVTGDLLGNADHPVLSSVWSTRLYLKRQNHAAQHLLTHVAEPLAALLPGPDARPLLALAWRTLLENHPHDDLCGCSTDAVHADDEARYRHVREIASEGVRERLDGLVLRGLAPTGAPAGPDVFVFNPHPVPLRLPVEADVLLPNAGGEFGTVPPDGPLVGVDGAGHPVAVTPLRTTAPDLRVAYLDATWGRRLRVRFEADVPALGYTVVRLHPADPSVPGAPAPPAVPAAPPADRAWPPAAPDAPRPAPADLPDGPLLENAHYRLDRDGDALALTVAATGARLAPALAFVWERDAGDTYSFGPVRGDTPRAARLVGVARHPRDPAAVVATYHLDVPRRLGSDRTVRLTLRVLLRLDGPRGLALKIRYRNRARDGRLRLVLPTGTRTDALVTGAHFGPSRRTQGPTVAPEDDFGRWAAFPGELPYPTHPSHDAVVVEGAGSRVWVGHRGLPEVELVDDGAGLAVTLARSVGRLSVKGARLRRVAAGPGLATPGAQCLRVMGSDVLLGAGPVALETALGHARVFAHPAWACELPVLPHAPAVGDAPRAASFAAFDPAGPPDPDAVWLSALRPETGGPGVVLRLVNVTDTPQPVALRLALPVPRACATDLHERWDDAAAFALDGGVLRATLAPRALATWVLR